MKSRQELLALLDEGKTFDYELFYGGWCCQWAPTPIRIGGKDYPTTEHYMMAEKARIFGDQEIWDRIMRTPNPYMVKAAGRKVKGFDQAVWERERYMVVYLGNIAKFSQNADAFEYLMGTGDKVIVECSPSDRVWGIGFEQDDKRCTDPRKWQGENLLGFICTEVRDHLREIGFVPELRAYNK